jgi:two-component system sensor histidine kinase FlrB
MLHSRQGEASIHDSTDLQAAFALFNRVSSQFTDSYRLLERRVEQLSTELEQVDRARLRELEEKEELSGRLRSLRDLLPAGGVVLDRKGQIVDVNPAAQDMLGGQLEGERWGEVICRAFAPRRDDGHEVSLTNGRRLSVDTRSLERDSGQVVLLTDQTETRELQDRLSRHQRLTAMGRMIAALAHQVRTPLAAAMLYASNLRDADLPPEQVRKFSSRIVERLAHMERQVRDMLVFVRGEPQPTDLVTVGLLFDDIQEAMDAPLAAARAGCSVHLECDPALRLTVNRDAVTGAVLNLVNNSLQAGGQGSRIELRLIHAGERLGIVVEDRGPGMSESVLKQIGQDFFTTRARGTGLGVAVVRSVARAHGGELDITSTPGTGTRACMWLRCDDDGHLEPVTLPVKELAHG